MSTSRTTCAVLGGVMMAAGLLSPALAARAAEQPGAAVATPSPTAQPPQANECQGASPSPSPSPTVAKDASDTTTSAESTQCPETQPADAEATQATPSSQSSSRRKPRTRRQTTSASTTAAATSSHSGSGDPPVNVVDNSFSPAQLTIDAGETVTWTNNGNVPHTVTADDGSFNSGTLDPGETFSHTFSAPAAYPYYCRFHGAPNGVGMSGTIQVSGGTAPQGQQTVDGGSNNPLPDTGGTQIWGLVIGMLLISSGAMLLRVSSRAQT